MNWMHWHLILNHLPIIGSVAVVFFLAWGIFARSREVKQAALVATVLVALATIPTFLTGHRAADVAERFSWFSDSLVGEHEERAEASLVALLVSGALAVAALWLERKRHRFAAVSSGLTLAALVVGGALSAWTASAGGVIRHDEIRGTSAIQPTPQRPEARRPGAHGHAPEGGEP